MSVFFHSLRSQSSKYRILMDCKCISSEQFNFGTEKIQSDTSFFSGISFPFKKKYKKIYGGSSGRTESFNDKLGFLS